MAEKISNLEEKIRSCRNKPVQVIPLTNVSYDRLSEGLKRNVAHDMERIQGFHQTYGDLEQQFNYLKSNKKKITPTTFKEVYNLTPVGIYLIYYTKGKFGELIKPKKYSIKVAELKFDFSK